tara:strand:- start:1127 stop:1945 length:819 start_codon:yes stop_codon:yes gene_type:complete
MTFRPDELELYYDAESMMRQRYSELEELNQQLKEATSTSCAAQNSLNELVDISWIFHENGLEGVVLTFPEIKAVVDNKIVSDVSLLPTYEDIKNQKYCIDLLREKAEQKRANISINLLKDMHGRLVGDPELAGSYRRDIPIHRTYFHEIEQPAKIHSSLGDVLAYVNGKKPKDVHPIEFAANVHHRFLRVYPFSKYSGFLGRLLGVHILQRYGFMPVIIHASDRQAYYEALRGPEIEFREFYTNTMREGLENSLKHFQSADQAPKKSRLRAS